MSAIKEGTTLYASLPYQPFPGREVKVVVELADGSISMIWISKTQARELAGRLLRIAK
jgi:hypothetical protein